MQRDFHLNYIKIIYCNLVELITVIIEKMHPKIQLFNLLLLVCSVYNILPHSIFI